jgi:hypothetical protein
MSMPVKSVQAICVVAALGALALAAIEISYIGIAFEEKSLFSYMLKSGETNPSSEDAIAHVQGAAAYGRLVALRVALGSAVFGALAGVLATQWRRCHATRDAA